VNPTNPQTFPPHAPTRNRASERRAADGANPQDGSVPLDFHGEFRVPPPKGTGAVIALGVVLPFAALAANHLLGLWAVSILGWGSVALVMFAASRGPQ
jgi:hypothetical protein